MRPDIGEDETALIYGLEAPARALAPGPSGSADSNLVRFCVGTQSLRADNVVHVLEYVEDTHSLSKQVFKHGPGEIWHLSTSAVHGESLVSSYSIPSPDGKVVNKTSLWKFPVDLTNSITDEDIRGDSLPSLEKVCDFDSDSKISRWSVWKPDEGDQLITFSEEKIFIWDINTHSLAREIDIHATSVPGLKTSSRLSRTSVIRWSPHCNGNILGIVVGSHVLGMDLRVGKGSSPFTWSLNAHNILTRDLDFNPNAQYYVATCGDDCESRFWDIRNPSTPALSFLNHSHWVWSIRYNVFHDQLVLTCSSDSRVVLTRVASLASQPFGHLLDETSGEDEIPELQKRGKNETPSDSVIATFDEHEDSVYAAEWSSSDPWIFASLSFDGRLVINKVPKREKMSILF